jgi:succinate dehydrogenase hydrophobic anchor subunit
MAINAATDFDTRLRARPRLMRERFDMRPVADFALVVCSCVAFIVAKSMTTSGRVRIDQFEYWLVGATPLAVIFLALFAVNRYSKENPRQAADARNLCVSWLITLLVFIVARETHYYEFIRAIIIDDLNIGLVAADWLMCIAMAAIAGFGVFGASIVRNRKALDGLSASLVINSVLFQALVYWLP